MDVDPIEGYEVLLAEKWIKAGFDPKIRINVYDSHDCNFIICCTFRDKHLHVPLAALAGIRPDLFPRALETKTEEVADRLLATFIQRVIGANANELLLMEVHDDVHDVN